MEPVVIAVADVPNKNNRVYSKSVLEHAVNECVGLCYGQIGMPVGSLYPTLEDVSHVVENLRFDDNNRLIGTVRLLVTPKAQELQKLLDNGVSLDFRLAGTGDVSVNEDGQTVVSNFSICSINAVNDGA